jgi:hypothetical protein
LSQPSRKRVAQGFADRILDENIDDGAMLMEDEACVRWWLQSAKLPDLLVEPVNFSSL